jgi:hypothetical protein
VAGTALRVGQLPHDHPDRDDAQAADQVTEDLLRTFGVPADEAYEICQRPLPNPRRLPRRVTRRQITRTDSAPQPLAQDVLLPQKR